MNKRPLSVTIISWLFIGSCGVGLFYHLGDFDPRHPLERDLILVCSFGLLALLGGAFLLRGHNWARWLLAAWMTYHIGLSYFHSTRQLIAHTLLFATIGYFLFHPRTSAWFKAAKTGPPREGGTRSGT